MKAPLEKYTVLEFSEINNVVDRLIVQLSTYIQKKFYQYDYVKTITIDNIIATLDKLNEEPATKKALDPDSGTMQKIGAVSYGYTVGWFTSETPYKRLEHLRYFAAKAVVLRNTTREMLRLSQLGTFDWTADTQQEFQNLSVLLIDELREFFQTSEALFTSAEAKVLTIQSKGFQGTLKGMKGSGGNSELADLINIQIVLDFKVIIEKIISEINHKVEATISRKLDDARKAHQLYQTSHSQNSATSTTPATGKESSKIFVNQYDTKGFTPLHEAIHNNGLERTLQCLESGANPNLCTLVPRPYPDHKDKIPHRSPLCLAILDDLGGIRNPINLHVVQALLEKKADINFLAPPYSRSFIHICVFTVIKKTGEFRPRDKFNLPLIKLLTDYHCDLKAFGWDDFQSLLSKNPNRSTQLKKVVEYLQSTIPNSKGLEN